MILQLMNVINGSCDIPANEYRMWVLQTCICSAVFKAQIREKLLNKCIQLLI